MADAVEARKLLPLAVLLAAAFVLLAIPRCVGAFFVYGQAPFKAVGYDSADLMAVYNLRQGNSLERDGLINEAVKEYRAALSAKSQIVRNDSAVALERLNKRREQLGPLSSTVVLLASLASSLGALLTLLLVLLIVGWLLVSLIPRRGTRMAEFPVYGSSDPNASRIFQDAFLRYSNDIKRVYGSQFALRFGIKSSFDALQGSSVPDANIYERALAEARNFETKAVARFALTEFIRWMNQLTSRPAILITGSVQLLPSAANASAFLRGSRSGDETVINATTAELSELQTKVKVANELLSKVSPNLHVSLQDYCEDLRQTSDLLCALALVLACKMRYWESQAVPSSYRPSSWKTVCVFMFAGSILN
jgi:hypothetical protein